jgi:oligopeptide/dipeptide ABC transporter ATP-binding protein
MAAWWPNNTIYNQPRHPYSQELLKAFPDLSNLGDRLAAIPGYPPQLDALPPGCRFAPRCPAVFDRCHTAQPPLYRLSRRDGSDQTPHYASCYLLELDQV